MIADIFSKPEVFWFTIGIIFFLLELVIPGFFVFFFGVGACTTALVCLIGNPGINLQITIFLVVSVATLLAFRKMIREKSFFSGNEKSKSIENEFTGKNAVVITDFDGANRGKVEFKGASWTAEANTPVKTGQIVEIIDIDGIILKVKLKND